MIRVGKVIGEGGFSLIYEAQQRPGRLPVAVKEFFPQGCWREDMRVQASGAWSDAEFQQAVEAFLQEGEMLAIFDHPGIVRRLGAFCAYGTAYLVEELLHGTTLAEGLLQLGKMPEEQVLELLRQVGDALAQVHLVGLVHSDVKPENIFMAEEGRYVLIDFGTAHSYLQEDESRAIKAAVSPGYSPLEQYQKKHRLTPAADVYALAATAYNLLSGTPPPDARDRSRGVEMEFPETTSPRVRRALGEALHLHPLCRTPGVGPFLEQVGVAVESRLERTRLGLHSVGERLAHLGATSALALHHRNQYLFSGGRDGRICASTWPDLQPKFSLQAHRRSGVTCLAVSPDGMHLVSGSHGGSVKLWSAVEKSDPHWLVAAGPAVRAIRFHPLLECVVAGFVDGNCRIFQPDFPAVSWQAHSEGLLALDLDGKGGLLATAGLDGVVHLWNILEKPKKLTTFKPEGGLVRSLCFNADGSGLLVCAGESHVSLWDVESRKEVRHFLGHRQEVWSAQFSCDPNLIVTASADHHVYLFRADSGRMLMSSRVQEGMTGALAADPQQRLLACAGADGSLRAWEFDA